MEFLNSASYLISNNSNLATALLTIVILIIYWIFNEPKGLPPGPLGLPIVGYLPFVHEKAHETFSKLAEKHGPIFRLYFGNQLVIVLNNYETIKEAFIKQNNVFAGRPLNFNFSVVEPDKYSIGINDGPSWRDHRRFALTILRDCGVGKTRLEMLIMEEIQSFLIELKKFQGKPTDFRELLSLSVCNNILILIFGRRLKYDDPWFTLCKKYTDDFVKASSAMSIFTFFPILTKIPWITKIVHQDKLVKHFANLKASLYDKIKEAKDMQTRQRDNYMDAFLLEQDSRKTINKSDDTFSDQALEENMRGFLLAGTETTATSLSWFIICMMLYPEVQKKVQNEIAEVIGTERTSCYTDRLRTPYTEATIYEVLRFANLVPTNVPHRNTKDCEILGYKIPRNSFILTNLWAVHNDRELWQDPEVFRPERFISENGKIKKVEYFIPFSLGKRQCLGEPLARMELYLYVTSMLQKFTFKSPEDAAPSMEATSGITCGPKYFKSIVLPRNIP